MGTVTANPEAQARRDAMRFLSLCHHIDGKQWQLLRNEGRDYPKTARAFARSEFARLFSTPPGRRMPFSVVKAKVYYRLLQDGYDRAGLRLAPET